MRPLVNALRTPPRHHRIAELRPDRRRVCLDCHRPWATGSAAQRLEIVDRVMGIRTVGDFYVHDRQAAGCTVVTIGGELDVATAPLLRSHLDSLMADGRTKLVLDLAGLDFLDASGVGVLARAMGRVRMRNGWMRLVHATPRVRRVLRITRLTDALPLYDTTAQALSGLQTEPARLRVGSDRTSGSNM